MLNRVTISNFRNLRQFDAELAPTTAILGPNSSGKTTVLHAIRLGCDLLRFALSSDARCRTNDYDGETWIDIADGVLIPDISAFTALTDWRALFVDQQIGEGVQATISLRFADDDPVQALWVRIKCARNQQLKLYVSARAESASTQVAGLPRRSSRINQTLTDYLVQHAPRAVLIPPFYGTVPNEEYRARVVIDRLLGTGDQSHVVRNLVSGLDVDRLQRLNSFLGDTIGARVAYRTTGDALHSESPLRVTFADTSGELELSAAGAGLVNLIALYATLARWRTEADQREIVFLLDEPEAHLAPRLQADSAARLSSLVTREFGAQVLMATHSVDILNRLSQEGAHLIRCDRTAVPTATPLPSDSSLFDDLAGWVDLTPYTAINFMASRRVLFCEGRTELDLIPRLGELRFRNQPEALRRFRRWAVIELGGTGNVNVAGLLDRLLRNDALRATPGAQPFQVEVVLDRDHHRNPGHSPANNNQPATTVWARHSLESLFVEPQIITDWVTAFLPAGEAPVELGRWVEEAIQAINSDADLNRSAVAALVQAGISALVRTGASLNANGGREVRRLTENAQQQVETGPEVWQRGKDRARAVLGVVRSRLPPQMQGQFPTKLDQLLLRANLNRLPDPVRAIPAEVNALLERCSVPRPPTRLVSRRLTRSSRQPGVPPVGTSNPAQARDFRPWSVVMRVPFRPDPQGGRRGTRPSARR